MEKAALEGFLLGYKFVNRSEEETQIYHLLFVDDTLVFCKDSRDQLAHLSWILLWFEAILELNINMEKIFVLRVGCVEDLETLAFELGYSTGTSQQLTWAFHWACDAIQFQFGME